MLSGRSEMNPPLPDNLQQVAVAGFVRGTLHEASNNAVTGSRANRARLFFYLFDGCCSR